MPTINVNQKIFNELKTIMVIELKNKFNETSSKNIIKQMVKTNHNKFGVTYNEMIEKMIFTYKKHNKIL